MKSSIEINREHYEPAGEGWIKCVVFTTHNERGEGYGRTEKQALKAAKKNLRRMTNECMGSE